MKEERLPSSDHDRVTDAATPNLVGAGAAFVLELFDLKNPSVLPADQHRDDCSLFIDIDGYIIKVDYTQQKKLAAAVSRVASNINQICRRINSTGHFYADDVAELKERQGEIWQLLKSSQSEEL